MRFLGLDLAWGEGSQAKAANQSGVVALDATGVILDAGWTIGLDATIDWIQRTASSDTVLFVDAPLVITNESGQRLAERHTGQRYGRWWVSANSSNLKSPRKAGVHLRERIERLGWSYSDGVTGPPVAGRVVSECYPYTTLVGVPQLGYDERRPQYKRASRGVPAAKAWPIRVAACDELIRRIAQLVHFDPPMDICSHPATCALLDDPSPANWRGYKPREDLLDAAICAWTAAYWFRHGPDRCQVLGLPPEAGEPPPWATIIAPTRPEQRRSTTSV